MKELIKLLLQRKHQDVTKQPEKLCQSQIFALTGKTPNSKKPQSHCTLQKCNLGKPVQRSTPTGYWHRLITGPTSSQSHLLWPQAPLSAGNRISGGVFSRAQGSGRSIKRSDQSISAAGGCISVLMKIPLSTSYKQLTSFQRLPGKRHFFWKQFLTRWVETAHKFLKRRNTSTS